MILWGLYYFNLRITKIVYLISRTLHLWLLIVQQNKSMAPKPVINNLEINHYNWIFTITTWISVSCKCYTCISEWDLNLKCFLRIQNKFRSRFPVFQSNVYDSSVLICLPANAKSDFVKFLLWLPNMRVGWKVHRLTKKEFCYSNKTWHAFNSTFLI